MSNSTSGPQRHPWRWLLPSFTQWLWLLLVLVLLSATWRVAMVASDGDACMHWAVGEHMLQTRQIVCTDVFSHTRYGAPIISKEWLSEIIFAVAGRIAGLDGVAVVAALLIATTFAWLHRQLLRDGGDLLAATVVTLLAAWAASSHWLARPHVFSFLMMLLWHDAIRRPAGATRLVVELAIIAVLWVNLHGAFLAGFFVLGAYWLGAVMERDWTRLRHLTLAGAVAAAATLLNPSGYRLHLHNLQFLRSEFFTGYLAEYSSTNFQSAEALGFLAWLALWFLILVIGRPRLAPAEVVLLLMWTYFALFAGRNIALLAILTAPPATRAISGALREHAADRWLSLSARMQELDQAVRGWPIVGLLAVAYVLFWPARAEMPPDKWPVAAVDYIKTHRDQFAGNLFNQYAWGGYLMIALPEHRTFVDGRADFFGEELVKEFQSVTTLRPGWQKPLEKYAVTWTLMPVEHRLNCALALLPAEWEQVYADATAVIWRKTK